MFIDYKKIGCTSGGAGWVLILAKRRWSIAMHWNRQPLAISDSLEESALDRVFRRNGFLDSIVVYTLFTGNVGGTLWQSPTGLTLWLNKQAENGGTISASLQLAWVCTEGTQMLREYLYTSSLNKCRKCRFTHFCHKMSKLSVYSLLGKFFLVKSLLV